MNIPKLVIGIPRTSDVFPFKLRGSDSIQIPVRPREYFEISGVWKDDAFEYLPKKVQKHIESLEKTANYPKQQGDVICLREVNKGNNDSGIGVGYEFLNDTRADGRVKVLYSNTKDKPFNITSVFDGAGNLLERLIHKANGDFVRTVWSADGNKCATHIVRTSESASELMPSKVFAWIKKPEINTTEVRVQEYDLKPFLGPKVTKGKNVKITVTPMTKFVSGEPVMTQKRDVTTTIYDTSINRQKTNNENSVPLEKETRKNIMESLAN